MLKNLIRKIYHRVEENYFIFCLMVWLKEHGIVKWYGFPISRREMKTLQRKPSEDMVKSKEFFEKNKERIENLQSMLADQKSREVLGGVIRYRTMREPIPEGLYSGTDQYFPEDVIRIDENEIFIDGGAYIGDTIQQFWNIAKGTGNKPKKIVAFEPDTRNYRVLQKFYGRRDNIIIVKKGLSNHKGILYFKEGFQGRSTGSRIVRDANVASGSIAVTSIDEEQECRDATWIKMDIEGSEWDALHGAKNVIKRNKPKLTICIYHSDEDLIRIAEYIHELVPEYRLYIRHHTKREIETVLYAIL